MNRFFEFFKQKLTEAKQQNQSQIQNILNAIDYEPYSNVKMLNNLQEMKTNYLQWNIMIVNQASTGLYFTQLHNKTACLKKVKTNKQNEERMDKNQIVATQMAKTLKELREIQKLNYGWTNKLNNKAQKLDAILTQQKFNKIQQKQLLRKQLAVQSENKHLIEEKDSKSLGQNQNRILDEQQVKNNLPTIKLEISEENNNIEQDLQKEAIQSLVDGQFSVIQ